MNCSDLLVRQKKELPPKDWYQIPRPARSPCHQPFALTSNKTKMQITQAEQIRMWISNNRPGAPLTEDERKVDAKKNKSDETQRQAQESTGTPALHIGYNNANIVTASADGKHWSNGNVTWSDDVATVADADNVAKRMSFGTPRKQISCPGYTGKGYYKLIQLSQTEEIRRSKDHSITRSSNIFPLTVHVCNMKGYEDLQVVKTLKRKHDSSECVYGIHSKSCDEFYEPGFSNKRCKTCQSMRADVVNMREAILREASDSKYAKYTTKQIAATSPEALRQKFHNVRHAKNDELRNLSRQLERTKQQRRLEESSDVVPTVQDKENIEKAIDLLSPAIEGKYGKDSPEGELLMHSVRMLKFPIGSKGARYPKAVMDIAVFQKEGATKQSYDFLKRTYHLPHPHHVESVLRRDIQEGDCGDGPCEKTIARMAEIVGASIDNPVWVIVAFDSVKTTSHGLILSNRKHEHGQILGIVRPEAKSDVVEMFEQTAHKFYTAEEKEVEMKYYGRTQNDIQLEEMDDAMDLTTEHSVYYATILDARYCESQPLKRSFICGRYSTNGIHGYDLMKHMDAISEALARHGFLTAITVKDACSPNQSWKNKKLDTPASQFIPKEVLDKYRLDGNTLVACKLDECYALEGKHDVLFSFITDDPVHVLKRVAGAMEDRVMCYGQPAENQPMRMIELKHVVDAVTDSRHVGALSAGKVTRLQYKRNNYERQNVRGTARILSATNVRMIRMVQDDEYSEHVDEQTGRTSRQKQFTLPKTLPEIDNDLAQRKKFLQRLCELVEHMDKWFDICNSRDKSQKAGFDRRPVTPENGVKLAEELLGFIRWVEDWKIANSIGGKVTWDTFLPRECYESLLSVSYTLVAMIYHFVVGKRMWIRFDDVNQDIVEHHFGHMRSKAGDTTLVNNSVIRHSETYSHFMRTVGVGTRHGNASADSFKIRNANCKDE